MQKKRTQMKKTGSAQTTANRPGGREFGNVIEPTQAQMASGNQGLAAESGASKSRAKKPVKGRS